MNAEETRNGLLQANDEEVTIRRTLPRTFRERRFSSRRGEIRRLGGRLTRSFQRNAGPTASLLAAPRAPGKKQETS